MHRVELLLKTRPTVQHATVGSVEAVADDALFIAALAPA